jgi:hypothetical protein
VAPKGKYSEELVDRAVVALRETGRDKDAIAVMRISQQTFYEWMGEKPEFREAVTKAKAEFTAKGWPTLRQLAKEAIVTHLTSVGQLKTVHTIRETTDPDGRVTRIEETKTMPVEPIAAVISLALEGGQGSREAYLMSQNLGCLEEVPEGQQVASVAQRIRAGLGLSVEPRNMAAMQPDD